MLKKYKWFWIIGAVFIVGGIAAFWVGTPSRNAGATTNAEIGDTAVAFVEIWLKAQPQPAKSKLNVRPGYLWPDLGIVITGSRSCRRLGKAR